MTHDNALNTALDGVDGAGVAEIEREGGSARVDAEQVGPLGVRCKRVRVERDEDWDIVEQAEGLPDRLRSIPDRVTPTEVAPELGGAILRTEPESVRPDGYFEVEVDKRSAEVRRVRVRDGEREPDSFTLTREQLGHLLDELEGRWSE